MSSAPHSARGNRQKPPKTKTAAGSKGGRPPSNNLTIAWRSRLDAVWEKQPSLRRDIPLLHSLARKDSGAAVRTIDDFRQKLIGKRSSSTAFAQAVYNAAGFSKLGITLEEWCGPAKVWRDALKKISTTDLQSVFDELARPDQLTVDLLPAPTLDTHRRLGASDRPTFRVNEKVRLRLHYDGEDALPAAHIAAFELDTSDNTWQSFSAVADSGLDHARAVSFSSQGGALRAHITLKQPLGEPTGNFVLYVLAQPQRFDHRINAILDRVDRKTGIVPYELMVQIADYVRQSKHAVLLAKTEYRVL